MVRFLIPSMIGPFEASEVEHISKTRRVAQIMFFLT
jgi:hypothetical protein